MFKAAVLGVTLVVMTACGTVEAGTIYVSMGGNDANDGLTWATAKKTVTAGLGAAVSGDQVWVAGGTYVERITLTLGVELYGGFAGGETGLSQRNWRTNVTILDGSQGGSVVAPPAATAATRIDGFTIRNYRGDSGGIYCYSSSPTITNNTITGNVTFSFGGGGIFCEYSSPMITNNTITGNAARSYRGGGGICCFSSSPTITKNTIAGNVTFSTGGGIYCDSSSPIIADNIITGNSASLDCGGGISCKESSPTITNNTITGNMASDNGGGIYCEFSSPMITNNTITGNTASYDGGGICYFFSSPTITNTIIAFNSSGIYSSGTPTLRYCCVYGNTAYNYCWLTDPTGTDGNISVDPQLADAGSYNVHLQPSSPCVDAGDDTAVQADWTDIDGQTRVQGAHVDIGADESDGTLWPAAPAILYVSPSGSDSNDGLSWATAKQTVQAGIDAGGTGSQVWVAAGTYVGTIRLGLGIALYGGFAGSETDLSQRNWRTNLTILDGNQAGSVVMSPPGATASTRINGFTIRNGKALYYGGGIYCYSSSPTIANNTITGNTTSFYGGGGIYCEYSSSPTITNNIIAGNAASSGGGIYCESSSPAIINNTITGNSASLGEGGGICCGGSSPTISNNAISGNTASGHGGGIYCGSSSPAITDNTVTGNTASYGGGGIYCYYSFPAITNTIIAFNSSGIDCPLGTPTLRYCCVYGNSIYNYSGLTDPTGTNGNISVDPLFVASPNAGADGSWGTADDIPGDVHLQFGSPCINAGDPTYVPAAGETDIDDQPRIIGSRIDIGADEYRLAGDVDYDGQVILLDLKLLVPAWNSTPGSLNWNPGADFDGDGQIIVTDLKLLVANWNRSLP